jgi:excisionase family DNA binding protein
VSGLDRELALSVIAAIREDAELAGQFAEALAPHLTFEIDAPDAWLNADSAAAHIDAPRSRIYDLAQSGRVPSVRDGRRLLVRRSDLDAYLDRS